MGAAYAGASGSGSPVHPTTLAFIGLIAGGGWACGQLLNDVLDREADSIDAPSRPAVRGLLPIAPTIVVALVAGLSLLGLLTALTPLGFRLGILSMVLILTYNWCKALPGLGNISHGAVIACASYVGAAIASPQLELSALSERTISMAALAFGWAALYLQGNYEKDARGDAHAGYRTLAHVLGPRKSALLRAGITACWAVLTYSALSPSLHRGAAVFGASIVCASALWVARKDDPAATLRGYRWTVHGAVIGMLALGGGALPVPAYLLLSIAAILLTELAFHRSPNP